MAHDPIAITGLGCRFPGANEPESFWRLLSAGGDAITEVPPHRFDIADFYDPRPGIPGKLYSRWGGFLDHVDEFDPYFFGISPREAAGMDPQHRLLLEVAWEALEDAGQLPDQLAGRRVGVFAGVCTNDYENIINHPSQIDIYFAAGNARSVLSGRLSYALGLEGPSIVVDTACSTSLVAVHLACQSLRSGESAVALAGGANLVLLPEPSIGFCQAQMLASDGRCKAFDARGDGFVRSDGIGIIVLKRLSQALADNDPIYAVIRGSAVNNDGRSGGLLMTPSRAGQEAVLRQAYHDSGIAPSQVQYVEAHGTGTSVGDPIEAMALGAVLGVDRPPDRPCRIGSVKTNIGHTEGAAGIAGIIKVALALKHHMLPASLHFKQPNPQIPWSDIPLVVQQQTTPWPADFGPAIAGVSSFGISGTNAHVVLTEAPERSISTGREVGSSCKSYLLPISAHTAEALEAMARAYQERVLQDNGHDAAFHDICYTASARRTHHDFRLSMLARSCEDINEELDAFFKRETRRGVAAGRKVPDLERKVVFVCPGQGSQWLGMARRLVDEERIFREAIERCAEALSRYAEWSLLDEIRADASSSRLEELDVVQPVLFAVQVALAALWRSWGIEPDAVVGHSMGEVAAAHVAGIINLDEAARIIGRRSQVVKRRASGHGKMAVVELPVEGVERLLAKYEGRVVVAACNGPTTTVISGEAEALGEISQTAQNQEIFFQFVKVDYASHSPQMDPLRDELLEVFGDSHPRQASVAMMSTTGAAAMLDGRECDAEYWVRNLRQPVFFVQAIRELASTGHNIFLELSAHPALAMSISQCLRSEGRTGIVLPSMRREENDRDVMLESFGALYADGYPVDWTRLYPSGGRVVPLPAYAWQRERFWVDNNGHGPPPKSARKGGHRLLDRYFKSAAHLSTHFWETELSTRSFPYLADHRVQGAVVVPAAAFCEMALAAASEAFGDGPHALRNLVFQKALFLADDLSKTVQVVLSPGTPGEASFKFFSIQKGETPEATETLHASGSIGIGGGATAEPPAHETVDVIRARCPSVISGPDFYRETHDRGLEYGRTFQGIEQLWRRDGEAIGQLRLSDVVEAEAASYHVHPAFLDASFQALAAALPREGLGLTEGSIFLPVGLETLRLHERPRAGFWSHAVLRSPAQGSTDTLEGDVFLIDEDGRVVLEALGFSLQRVGRDASASTIADWIYEIQWQPAPRTQPARSEEVNKPEEPKRWIIFSDSRIGPELQNLLSARGDSCVVVFPGETHAVLGDSHFQINPTRPEDYRQLVAHACDADGSPCTGILHLWAADSSANEMDTLSSIEKAQDVGCLSALNLVHALADLDRTRVPRLWFVTVGTQAAGDTIASVSIAQSPLWGVAGVIGIEHPELRCTRVDLSPSATPEAIEGLFQELQLSGDREDQIAFRDGKRWVPRVVRHSPEAADEKRRSVPASEPFRLEIATAGILDNLTLRSTTHQEPGPGQVQIQIRAVGLNFRDVLVAMGLIPPVFEQSLDLGWECAGTIVRCGAGVDHLKPGDDVVALAPSCLGSFVTTDIALVARKPAHLSFEEAVTIPITFMTAYYALHHLGRLSRGERVLIHAAAGGVGQAAIQIAKQVGAEIYATAGTSEKREFLKAQGVRHVMDSRSLDFADEVMRITNGEGVDVVLNSLAGEFIPRSLATLRPGGRFLEIGMTDILQDNPLGLRVFQKNLTFSAINLARMFVSRSAFCGDMLREVLDRFVDGSLKPLPLRIFPLSQAPDAFRYMAQAKHIGKVVITLDEKEFLVAPPSPRPVTFRSDATYLVTGGLGGLGLVLAQWMVERGARHLVLVGRSGATSAAAHEALAAMQKRGASVVVARANVADTQEIARVIDDIDGTMPPLRGVIHLAAVLDDGILLQMNQDRFQRVMAPKMYGAWNLHTLTLDKPLDLFVLFSSVASVLASPGQGNYVAANTFLDVLAHHRRARGLPGLSINWGLWAEVGLAAQPDITGRLMQQGIHPFSPAQGMKLLDRALQLDSAQVIALSVDWGKLLRLVSPPILSALAAEVDQKSSAKPQRPRDGLTRDKLLAAAPEERQGMIGAFLVEQIARVLRCSPSKIDVHQPLTRLGIDSLMAVELKNRVEVDLELTIPVTALLQGPSLSQLSARLTSQLPVPAMAATVDAVPLAEHVTFSSSVEHGTAAELLSKMEELSDEAVNSLLKNMLIDEAVANDEEEPEEMGG
jgi:acyl transferase domain-containing protein/NADP-dependent 3-hydroxy acid dehydrogenase YdfG/acyl carrier protein